MPSIHHPPIHQHTSSSIYLAITINIPSIHLSQFISHQRDPFPTYLHTYTHIYLYTHTLVCPSVISRVLTFSCLPPPYPSPHVSFYLPAHPSQPLTRRGWGASLLNLLRAPDIFLWIVRSTPRQAAGPLLPHPGSPGEGIEWVSARKRRSEPAAETRRWSR